MARGARRFDLRLLPPSPDLAIESGLWQQALTHLAGIDEAGRGALAGPVSAAAVILPPDPALAQTLHGVRDSKQMRPRQRELWAGHIRQSALTWGVGMASCAEIDAIGIVPATRLAVQRALDQLLIQPDHLLLDFLLLPANPIPQTSLIKGDCRSLSIAAASVLAKTARDAWMTALSSEYPAYGFAVHKGYGTAAHLDLIERLGPTPQHRRTFSPLRNLLAANPNF